MKYKIDKEEFIVAPRLTSLIKKYSHGKSLDAGCGTGEYFKYFNGEVVGIDKTDVYLKKINIKQYKNKKITLKKADVRKIPFADETFDFIFSAAVLEYMKDKKELEQAVNEFKRVLKKGGYLVVSTPHQNSFTHFVRKNIIGKVMTQEATDPYFIMGKAYDSKTLKQYKFNLHGCLFWVTWQNLPNDFIAKLFDTLFWYLPFFSGTLIGIYEKE